MWYIERNAAILQLHKDGVDPREIAERYDLSVEYILSLLNRMGAKRLPYLAITGRKRKPKRVGNCKVNA